nr:hypothetical protein [Methylobacterium pseudosasicola]
MDRVEDGLHRTHHIGIAEAEDAKTLRLKEAGSLEVIGGLPIQAMLIAIDFHDEMSGETAEIGHIGSKRDLPAKVRAIHRQAMAQMPPETPLSIRKSASEGFRVRCGVGRRRLRRMLVPGHAADGLLT